MAVQAGDFPAECPITLTKKGMVRARRWIDRNTMTFMIMMISLGLVGGAVFGIVKLVMHFT